MPIITATEVTVYSNISASAATITSSGLIPIVQHRINMITNNWFLTDLYLQDTMTFNATARTVVAQNLWASEGFADGDEVYVFHSYRNDGYYTSLTFSSYTLTLATGSTVVDELSGRSILVSVVAWPAELKYTAAQMIEYDYDDRPKIQPGLKSRSLGPFSESYGGITFGYPEDVLTPLYDFRVVRLM